MRDDMKYITALLTLSLALFACSSCATAPQPRERVADELPAVALLVALDSDADEVGTCTAWKISEDMVVTAGHCCNADLHTYIMRGPHAQPGTEARPIVDLYTRDDSDNPESTAAKDVCVMRGHLSGPAIKIALRDPAIGERVWTVGYPHAVPIISDGYWSGRYEKLNGVGIVSVVGHPGASGSPIMNGRGESVGVLVRYREGMDNMVFSAPLEKLRIAIRQARLLPKED